MNVRLVGDTVRVGIVAAAHYAPERVMTSGELEKLMTVGGVPIVEMLAGQTERLSGVRERRWLADDEFSSTLAARAVEALPTGAVEGVDLLVFASASRDMVEPATGSILADMLSMPVPSFDVSNACNSFLNGVQASEGMLRSGMYERALVVTGESCSRVVKTEFSDLDDLRAHIAGPTLGDGGAAFVLAPVQQGGFLHWGTRANPSRWDMGGVYGGGSRHPRTVEHSYFTVNGVGLRQAFEELGPELIEEALSNTGTSWSDYRYVLIHQVTKPYVRLMLDAGGVPERLIVDTVSTRGNIASATLPTQYSMIADTLAPGDLVMFIGLAGGISATVAVHETVPAETR